MRLEPLGSRVVVKEMDPEDVTPGGIVLPEASKVKTSKGKVLAVGEGQMLDDGTYLESKVQDGDIVYWVQFTGTEVEVDGETLRIINEAMLIAKERDEPY